MILAAAGPAICGLSHCGTDPSSQTFVWKDAGSPDQFAVIVLLILLVIVWGLGLQGGD